MADRSVLVRLLANATQYKAEMRSAGAATDATTDKIDRQGTVVTKTQKDIDRFSGRLRYMAEAGAVLGPTLIPLGGAAVTGIAALSAGLVAAGGAAGTLLLALKGVGDGVKALQKFQDDPTAENFQAMREEMDKLGPSAEHFVRYLDSIEPELRKLQMAARDGMLPGFEDGIDSFLEKGPQVQRIIANISSELGSITADAGASLAGPKFEEFFNYMENDAVPIMDDFLRSTGNVAEGLANLLVAFNPASQGFSDGLLSMTERFAEWSRTLDTNQSFQEFLSYLQRTGPEALQFLGSLTDALVGITRAAAPWGEAVLPVLSKLLDLTASLANSPLGTPLFTAAAGMLALNRAAKLLGSGPMVKIGSMSKVAGSGLVTLAQDFALVGTSAMTAGAKSEREMARIEASTRRVNMAMASVGKGASFLAILTGIGLVDAAFNKLGDHIDEADLGRNIEALANGAQVDDLKELGNYIQQVGDNWSYAKDKFSDVLTLGIDTSTLEKSQQEIEKVDQALASLVESGKQDVAAAAFDQIVAATIAAGGSAEDAETAFDAYGTALDNSAASADKSKQASHEAAAAQNRLARETEHAVVVAKRQADAMKEQRAAARETGRSFVGLGDDVDNAKVSLNGWIQQLAENARALENFADNAVKAARRGLDEGLIKSLQEAGTAGALRMKQLANASDEQLDKANAAWRRGQKAIRDYINLKVPPKDIKVDTAQAKHDLRVFYAQLAELNGTHVTTYIDVVRQSLDSKREGIPTSADGGSVPKGGPYRDSKLYMLAPGEEIISNRHGQADRFRADRAARRIPGYAEGGTVGTATYAQVGAGGTPVFAQVGPASYAAADALYSLADAGKKELTAREKLLQKEFDGVKQHLDALKQQRDSLAQSVKDLIAGGELFTVTPAQSPQGIPDGASQDYLDLLAQHNAQLDAQPQVTSNLGGLLSDGRERLKLIRTIHHMGVDGAALAYLATQPLEVLRELASSKKQSRKFENQFNQLQQIGGQAGTYVGDAVYGKKIDEQITELRGVRAELKDVKQHLRKLQDIKDATDKGADKVVNAIKGSVSTAARSRR